MPPVNRTKPEIGDVIEIPTPFGFAYAHYTHKHTQYSSLIRVLPCLYHSRPAEFTELVTQKPQFMAFFPLATACNREIVRVVANEKIPIHAQEFPIFRARIKTPSGNGPWWLWDGEIEWKVGALKPGMESFPVRGILNDTLLIERISQGWHHELDT